MDIKFRFAIKYTATAIIFIATGCGKLCHRNYYNFNIASTTFSPSKDSLKLGDTVFLNSKTPTKMINISDGKEIDYSNSSNFGSVLGVGELIGINDTKDAVMNFNFIPIKGQIYTDNGPAPGRAKQVKFLEENGYYILSIGIVPQKKGIYILSTADMPDVVKNCSRAAITMKITNVDPHLHYLQDIYYGGGQIYPLDSTHAYCFEVY